ncbi:MAG: hypothetical protein AAFQ79_04285 [Pseudomonadota bacterium]
MGPLALPYVILPGAGAVATAWAIADWRLAGAAAAGAMGLLFLVPALGLSLLIFALPVIAGVAVGGLVLLPLLLWRPDMTVWTRMTTALAAAVAGGLWLLTSNPGLV